MFDAISRITLLITEIFEIFPGLTGVVLCTALNPMTVGIIACVVETLI